MRACRLLPAKALALMLGTWSLQEAFVYKAAECRTGVNFFWQLDMQVMSAACLGRVWHCDRKMARHQPNVDNMT